MILKHFFFNIIFNINQWAASYHSSVLAFVFLFLLLLFWTVWTVGLKRFTVASFTRSAVAAWQKKENAAGDRRRGEWGHLSLQDSVEAFLWYIFCCICPLLRNRINKPVWRSSTVLGCPVESVTVVSERRMSEKLKSSSSAWGILIIYLLF